MRGPMSEERYPTRTKWSHRSVAEVGGGEVAMRGRLLRLEGGRGILRDQSGEIDIVFGTSYNGIKTGDIAELLGVVEGGEFRVAEFRVLAPAVDTWDRGDWARFNADASGLRDNLTLRAAIVDAVRQFFSTRGFLAVDTPILISGSAQEEEIQLFATEYREGKTVEPVFLAPSPELHMKRLLGVGIERIYQITRSFRNGEIGPLHNPEFTLLEWYRAYGSYEEIMEDVECLLVYVAEKTTGESRIFRQGKQIELSSWKRISVHEAFLRWANIDLGLCNEVEQLFLRANELGYGSAKSEDTWADLFHKILVEVVEPELACLGAVHLVDYPRQLAALAKQKEGQPAVVERAEAYIGGVELTNGYTELNDPAEQRRRFAQTNQRSVADWVPADEDFLVAMERGFPPAGGVALGIDRLLMLIAGADSLDEVIAFPAVG